MRASALMTLFAAVMVWSLAGASPAHAKRKIRTYTVQPGDSIWSIAEAFYGSGNKYRIIYEHNKLVGVPPFILVPGQVLRLPVGRLTPEAQVDWLQRSVKAKPPRSLDWVSASKKMNLWKLYKVSTGEESAVHIVFEDKSDLRLGDNALLVIYGGSKKNAKAKKREKTRVLLEEGTARGGLAALDAGSEPMVVETPSGMIELSSEEAQITVDALISAVSVYKGQATVKSAGAAVKVKKGYGTVVKKGKKPEKPRPLPAPPGWAIAGEGAAVAVVPAGGTASFEAAWTPVEGAHTYRVELAHDEHFKRVLVNVVVDKDTTRFHLDKIPTGNYFARISARSRSRLEGSPSPALAIDVVGLRSSRRLARGPDGEWEVAGFSRLDLGDTGPGLEWALDDGDFMPGTEPARVQGAGSHQVRVRRVGATVVTPFELRVLAIKGTLELASKEPLAAGGPQGRGIALVTADERGQPAPLPNVVLAAVPGGTIPLTAAGEGRWTGVVPAPELPGPEQLALRADWPGGALAMTELEIIQKFPDVPYVYQWRTALSGLPWDGRDAATPLPGVAPIDRIGIQTAVIVHEEATFAGLTMEGEIGLLDESLALDAAWTLFRPTVSRDELQAAELGDVVLGARYLAVRQANLLVAPSLRGRLPVRRRDGVRVWGIEPGVLLRYRAAESVWLDTRQGVMLALSGDANVVSYVGDYAAILRTGELLNLSLELDSAVTISAPDGYGDTLALAAGVGAQLHLGRVRFGLSLGFGLGSGGRQRFGEIATALTVDFGKGTPDASAF